MLGYGHIDLCCRDVDRSVAFYLSVLGPLGLQEPITHAGERGETIRYLRLSPDGGGSLGLRPASGPEAAHDVELYAPGLHHLAFAVDARADVDAAHAAAVMSGAPVLHAPTAFPRYHPDYYATFFLDPDGVRVEVRSLGADVG